MNENLNLVEILKDVPKGTKLWSPVYGVCTFVEVNKNTDYPNYPIFCKDNKGIMYSFTKEGKLFDNDNDDTECILFPSRENRDWSTFKVPKTHKEFEPYQKVLVKIYGKSDWNAGLYSHYDALINRHYLVGGDWIKDEYIIPYEENKDKLGKPVE